VRKTEKKFASSVNGRVMMEILNQVDLQQYLAGILTSVMEGIDADIFAQILRFYLEGGARVLDATCGTRIFWRKIQTGEYEVTFNDVREELNPDSNWDITDESLIFPYKFDAIIFDPPHLDYSKSSMFYKKYGSTRNLGKVKTLSEMFEKVPKIFSQLLTDNGLVIAKLFDDRKSGNLRMRHVEFYIKMMEYFDLVDFIVKSSRKQKKAQKNWRGGRKRQTHSLVIHSYYMIFRKK